MATISPTDMSGSASMPVAPQKPAQSHPDTTDKAIGLEAAAEQAPKVEAKSPELAKLAQQERALRAQARALQAERAKLQQEQEQAKTTKSEYEKLKAWKERTIKDPYSGLLDEGLTSDQVASLMLNQPAPVDQNITLLQREIQEMKQAREQERVAAEQARTQQYENAKKQILQEVKVLVDGNDSFELIRADGAEQLVVDTIEEYYKEHNEILSAEEASTHIEEILLERALKNAQLKKIKAKLGESVQAPVTEESPVALQVAQKPAPTLTNRMSQSSNTKKALSWEERKQRAIAAAQGKLA